MRLLDTLTKVMEVTNGALDLLTSMIGVNLRSPARSINSPQACGHRLLHTLLLYVCMCA
jgi:hypothetical protein